MKPFMITLILILLAGCDYEVPLSKTAACPANTALTGAWLQQDGNTLYQMNIQTAGNDYTVTYGETGEAPLTFKGFDVSAAGFNLIQLELQGAETTKYLFVKYELTADGLSVSRLSPDVVSAKCQTTEELAADMKVHRDNPALFSEPMEFTRSAAQ